MADVTGKLRDRHESRKGGSVSVRSVSEPILAADTVTLPLGETLPFTWILVIPCDAEGALAEGATGTVTLTFEVADGGGFEELDEGVGEIDLTDPVRSRRIGGPVRRVRATPANIAGATHYKLAVTRTND